MNRSTWEQFELDSQHHTIVPVWRSLIADTETPVAAFRKLTEGRDATLFESVEHGDRWGRFSFIALDPFVTLRANGLAVHVSPAPEADDLVAELMDAVPTDRGILAALDVLLNRLSAPKYPELPPFHGGISGYLGYDVVREIERLTSVMDNMVLTPRILGKATGLPPAMVLLALSVWGSLMGLLGMILALPFTTVLIAYLKRYVLEPAPQDGTTSDGPA